MSAKFVFRLAWSPDVTIVPSLLFLVSRFCTPPEVKFDPFVHQNTWKENRYRNIFLLYLSVHWEDLIEQIKKSVIYTLRGITFDVRPKLGIYSLTLHDKLLLLLLHG